MSLFRLWVGAKRKSSFIHSWRRGIKHKYKPRRRDTKKFIALALRARQKWICKYFMQKEKPGGLRSVPFR